jgi:hypothetical protein
MTEAVTSIPYCQSNWVKYGIFKKKMIFCYRITQTRKKMERNFIQACKAGYLESGWAVQLASEKGDLEIVKWLVFQKGADITAGNNWAVQLASKNGHLKVVQWLVSQGANIRTNNYLPLQLASKNGHFEVVKWLVSQGAPTTNISEKARHYLSFCKRMEEKMKEKKRIRAQKKIYFWWIQICYDIARPCGRRMAERNLALYHSMINDYKNCFL